MEDLSISLPAGGAINVWYRRPRSGSPTAVLLHGLTGTSRLWIPVLSLLPDALGIIAPDMRGRGKSSQCPGPYDLTTLAADTIVILDELADAKVTLVGYSMGAWIAALAANTHPDRLDRALLLDGGIPVPINDNLTDEEIVDDMFGGSIDRIGMSFHSIDDYFDYFRAMPTLDGVWSADIEQALRYDLEASPAGFRARGNATAVRIAGREITTNPAVITAGEDVRVATTLIIVDRGMDDQPGGFVPTPRAQAAQSANPLLSVEMWPGLNHDTLVLGQGASKVAAAIGGQRVG